MFTRIKVDKRAALPRGRRNRFRHRVTLSKLLEEQGLLITDYIVLFQCYRPTKLSRKGFVLFGEQKTLPGQFPQTISHLRTRTSPHVLHKTKRHLTEPKRLRREVINATSVSSKAIFSSIQVLFEETSFSSIRIKQEFFA